MSRDILFEMNFFFHSFLLGIAITFVYDWLLIFRRLVRHNIVSISLEDLIFWIACALGVFYMLYRENNGILRWFAIFAAALGMWAYKKTVSPWFIRLVSGCIGAAVRFILRPVIFAGGKIGQFFRRKFHFIRKKVYKMLRFAKKKLTLWLKLVKIMLCKQNQERVRNHGKKNRIS